MPQYQAQKASSFKPNRRTREQEDIAWGRLYQSVRQPAAAAEVVQLLERDREGIRNHLALYLTARETLNRQAVVNARNRRIGTFVRSALVKIFLGPFRAMRKASSSTGAMALEMLPPPDTATVVDAVPAGAKRRIDELQLDPDVARTIAHRPGRRVAPSDGDETSRSSKAA
jgi:hypothetical protein